MDPPVECTLEDCNIVYALPPYRADQIEAVQVAGITINVLDIQVTHQLMETHCSKEVLNEFGKFTGGCFLFDVEKATKFHALLFLEKWKLHGDSALFDNIVKNLLVRLAQ